MTFKLGKRKGIENSRMVKFLHLVPRLCPLLSSVVIC